MREGDPRSGEHTPTDWVKDRFNRASVVFAVCRSFAPWDCEQNDPVRRQRGSVKRNLAPSPGMLWTHMRPPCSSTIVRDTYKPKPDPGTRPTVVDNRLKRWKRRLCSSGAIPGPRSLTDTLTSSGPGSTSTRTFLS